MSGNQEDQSAEIETMLSELEEKIETRDFREKADAVKAAFSQLRLRPECRQRLWGRYQDLWARRREHTAARQRESEVAFYGYRDSLAKINSFAPSVESMIMDSDDWREVGAKARDARAELGRIQSEMRADRRLVRNHREELHRLAQDAYRELRRTEEELFNSQERTANRLLNEADSAVSVSPTKEAWQTLRENSGLIRKLYLRRSDRDLYYGALDDLWEKLKSKKSEEQARWRERQEEWIRRQYEALEKSRRALERVQANISANEERLESSRSDDFSERVQGWIDEGRTKETDIEATISRIEESIREAEARLQR